MGCVEPFIIPDTDDFQNVLIVEGTLTDVFGIQEIKLSRTSPLGTTEIFPETTATVTVTREDDGTVFTFTNDGYETYKSDLLFSAEPNVGYSLEIQVESGEIFKSSSEQLPASSDIENLVASSIVDEDNGEGVQILLSSTTNAKPSQFYRYEYQETYRIVAPQWSSRELFIISENPPNIGLRFREQEELICYGTSNSNEILQFTTEGLVDNTVTDLPIRFLGKKNPFIAHRYSILVKQFSISPEAYRYYNTLRELSGQENLLSQQQPGFLVGNILVEEGSAGGASGYFSVASLSEKRIFFDFDDFYDSVNITAAYPADCNNSFFAPRYIDQFGNSPLIESIKNESYEFLTLNRSFSSTLFGPYIMVPRICGDCTVLGSNVPPDFWVD